MKKYTALIVVNCRLSIDSDKAIPKNNTRFNAENYLIVALAFGLAIYQLYYIPLENKCAKVRKIIENAPIGANVLYNMTSKGCGSIPVFPVIP